MLSGLYDPEHLSNILDDDVSPKVWPVSGVLMRFLDGFDWKTRFPWLPNDVGLVLGYKKAWIFNIFLHSSSPPFLHFLQKI